jgi:hypothetical protein
MAKLGKTVDQTTVWAAACAAYRLNDNEYLKVGVISNGRKSNKELVNELLANTADITADDREQGQIVREYIGKVATTAALRGTLDIWGKEMARVTQLDQIEASYDVNVIASMPATYARYLDREKVHTRLAETTGEYTACVGDKLELDVEVLDNKYSKKWATYYTTVVDTENRAWYFACRVGIKAGSQITIKGTVKRIQDRMVQLNRVRIKEKA